MKLSFPAFFIAVLFLGGITLRAEDWTTIDGKAYPQVKIIKVEPDAVTILYRDGGALIPLIMLPDELQKRFHYDAATAKAAADAREKADFENMRALHAEYLQIMAQKQALLKAQDPSADDSTKTAGDPLAPPDDASHHSLGELAGATRSLGASYDDHHYSMGDLREQSSSLQPPADDRHYSMSSLFGSGDPLGR